MFCVAESLVKRGQFTVNPTWYMGPDFRNFGLDGQLYSKYGLGQSLLAAPLCWLAARIPWLGNAQTVMLLNLFLVPISCVVLFFFALRLGYSAGAALAGALICGLCTPFGIYAKFFFSEPLVGLSLLLAAYLLLRYRKGRSWKWALASGAALGWLALTKVANAVAVPLFVLYGFWPHGMGNGEWRKGLRDFSFFILPIAISLAATGLYNYLRFGDALSTGYQTVSFSTPLLKGVYGLLFSPGKGLFVYAPILLGALLAFPAFWRRHRAEAMLTVALFVLYCAMYGKWYAWRGGVTNWGPRLIVPVIPFLVLALLPALEFMSEKNLCKVALGGLSLLSAAFQAEGAALAPVLYETRMKEITPDWVSTLVYDPRYSPLVGYLPLLRPENLDLAWVRADEPGVHLDWAIIGPLLALCLASGGLVWLWRKDDNGTLINADKRRFNQIKSVSICVSSVLICVLLISGLALWRAHDDPRYYGDLDYQALLAHLDENARPDDTLILQEPGLVNFFLNYNKAPLDWYCLDEGESPEGSEEVAALYGQLLMRHRRIWLVTEPLSPFGWPGPSDVWLAFHAYKISESTFGNRARLVLFGTGNVPDQEKPQRLVSLRLGEKVKLLGYDLYLPSPLQGGQAMQLSFLWQALEPIRENFIVFVHLIDAESQLRFQVDRPGVDGYRPTWSWWPGRKIRDNFWLEIPAEIPPGKYRLIAGMYHLDTLERLPVYTEEGRSLGDHILLAEINVSQDADKR